MSAKRFILVCLQYWLCDHMRTFKPTANNQAVNTEHCILFHKTLSATGFAVLSLNQNR